MSYRRVLLVTEIGADPVAALAPIPRLAPHAEVLTIVACPPPRPSAVKATVGEGGPDAAASAWLDRLGDSAGSLARRSAVALATGLDAGDLAQIIDGSAIDLVIAGPRPTAVISVLAELRKRCPIAVAWIGPAAAMCTDERPLSELFCVSIGKLAESSIAAFLRDHGHPGLHVSELRVRRPSPAALAAALEVSGVRAAVDLVTPRPGRRERGTPGAGPSRAVDLVVLARFPGPLLGMARVPAPILVLPAPQAARPAVRRPLDLPDLLDMGGVLRLRIACAFGVGRNPPIPDQEVAFVAGGQVVATVTTHEGEAELPSDLAASTLGVFRVEGRTAMDPVAAIERCVAVIRRGAGPLVPFDAELSEGELAALARAQGVDLLAVRLRPVRSCHLLRDRLRSAGLAARVVDASAVLEEGHASDVGEALNAIRLARVGARLRAAGFPIAAIVHRGPRAPAALGFEALRPDQVADRAWELPPPIRPPASLPALLDANTGAERLGGNRVELELENGLARRWLIEVIDGATERIHLQTYLAADDEVGRQIEAALCRAARRGVTVRVLIDSLHGLHGSLGLRNPIVERISACAGVELRLVRPVARLPSLEDLKLRDHRKLVVADGRVAVLGGRNLAYEYLMGFEEVKLTPQTPWQRVPWLDAGARVEGPAVAALERSFLEAWTEAGGSGFEVRTPPATGQTAARVVVHRGLRDAGTLEAYLALIETARSHLYAVNGFPLLLEIQHALLRAVRRGVRVRTLFGPVTPSHAGELFEGQWSTARSVGSWFVESRMDALVEAGAEAYQLALRDVPGWAPDLGVVRPHVHAKLVSADGQACAVGSANLDITGCYWESELLLVVEDPAVTRPFEARLDRLMAGSIRLDREDPAWRRLARRREWVRHWPGVLSP